MRTPFKTFLRVPPLAALAVLAAAGGSPLLGATATDPAELLRTGRFREAQAAYEARAAVDPNDARLRYNAGVAAFKSGDTAAAERHFEAATAAPDLKLQQQAWYNLGATRFQNAGAPEAKDQETTLTQAADAFTAATQLAPEDRAAMENLAAVKQVLEELKQQQQDQQPQSGDQKQKQKNQKPDQKQKQDKQSGKKDGQKDSQKDSGSEKDPAQDQNSGDKSDGGSSAQDSAGKKDGEKGQEGDPSKDQKSASDQAKADEKEKQDAAGKQGEDKKKDGDQAGQKPAPDPNKKPGEKGEKGDKSGIQRADGKPAGDGTPGEGQDVAEASLEKGDAMTVQQAKQMLDAQKGAEKPIWTLVRGWGQENQTPRNAQNKRRTW